MFDFDRLFITRLSIIYMLAKGEKSFHHFLRPTHEVKAKAAPNLQNRKWLNFQAKIERKSKVSKVNDVETVETVEAGEATGNGYEEREAVTLDQHIGFEFRGQTIFSTICGQNSRVPLIPGCRDPRVT